MRLQGRVGALSLNVAFDLSTGVTALTGPSGSGKSTVLRALAGLERLSGSVRIHDEVWQDSRYFRPAHLRAVGYVFQHAALLPHLTVRGNLDYGRRRAQATTRDLDQFVALLRLEALLERSPSRLSGGERQRVAIARALVTRPRLLLLDEPLSGLDVAAKSELLPRLLDVFAQAAIPVVYVTHDPHEIVRVDARLSLEAGRIVREPPEARSAALDTLAGRSQGEIEALALAALHAGLPLEGR